MQAALVERRAGMRAPIEQREEFAIGMEHDDVAALELETYLVTAGRDVRRAGDDVTGHDS